MKTFRVLNVPVHHAHVGKLNLEPALRSKWAQNANINAMLHYVGSNRIDSR